MSDFIKIFEKTTTELGIGSLEFLTLVGMFLLFVYLFNMFQKHFEKISENKDGQRESQLEVLLFLRRNLESDDKDLGVIVNALYSIVQKCDAHIAYRIYEIIQEIDKNDLNESMISELKNLVYTEIERVVLYKRSKRNPDSLLYGAKAFFSMIGNIFVIFINAICAWIVLMLLLQLVLQLAINGMNMENLIIFIFIVSFLAFATSLIPLVYKFLASKFGLD